MDTMNYAIEYNNLESYGVVINWRSEWVWSFLMVTCKKLGFSLHVFLTIIEAGYIFSVLWAVKRFVPSNPMLGMLFVFSSLMFFTFGVNGIRNGLACHLTLLAIAFLLDNRYFPGMVVALLAFGCHRSVFLPIIACMAGRFFVLDYKYAIYFWLLCIVISLSVGGVIANMFASLGFDDRMTQYLTNRNNDTFSSTGFRWDFLLYSFPPVLLGWYVLVKRKIRDDWFRILCITYTLCNAFWILVIRVAFSNRFAYLSWFLYPIVIAYALINLPIWLDQDKKIGFILTCYCGFTIFMNTFVW